MYDYVKCLKQERKIIVNGYYGSWSIIDDYKGYVLLEHNTYGDETCYLIVQADKVYWDNQRIKDGKLISIPSFWSSDVYETYDDIETALNDYDLISEDE